MEDEYNKLIKSQKFKNFIERFPGFNLGTDGQIFSSPTTQEDMALYMELANSKNKILFAKYEITNLKNNPKQILDEQRSSLSMFKKMYNSSIEKIKETKLTVDVLKDVWIPTKENLKGKTRKEILENIHKMNGVLYNPSVPEKVRGVLGWSNAVATNNLHLLRNPFSWHEFTGGQTEAPSYPTKLDDFLKNSEASGYGYGPSTYGGGGGGGGRYPGMGMGIVIQGDIGGPSDSEDSETNMNEERFPEYNGGY